MHFSTLGIKLAIFNLKLVSMLMCFAALLKLSKESSMYKNEMLF